MIRTIALGGLAGIFFVQVGWAAQAGFQPSNLKFSYAVKFVCGPASNDSQVVRGIYATAINVHNPSFTDDVRFMKKFVLAEPDQKPGEITDFEKTGLPANTAFEIDCPEIIGKFSSSITFVKGFVVIVTPVELDITAVYTARPSGDEGVSTMDVEAVQPRRIVRKAQITPVPVPDRP